MCHWLIAHAACLFVTTNYKFPSSNIRFIKKKTFIISCFQQAYRKNTTRRGPGIPAPPAGLRMPPLWLLEWPVTPTHATGPTSNASSMAPWVAGATTTNATDPASYANILANPLAAFPPRRPVSSCPRPDSGSSRRRGGSTGTSTPTSPSSSPRPIGSLLCYNSFLTRDDLSIRCWRTPVPLVFPRLIAKSRAPR